MVGTRLQPLTLRDFTGGLNVRENSFQLGDNESPAMLNVHVDERVGFATREGWVRVTPTDDAALTDWDPRNAVLHQYADGSYAVYVANAGKLYRAASATGALVDTTIPVFATPHLADYAPWGDALYVATGAGHASWKRDEAAATPLTEAGDGHWNDDYTTPGYPGSVMPSASLVEAHAGYLFVADVYDDQEPDGTLSLERRPNRIRWSHPSSPEDWASADFLDIDLGGSRIRAIQSFTDHLLIFKDSSVWGLYGYDRDSWQLVQVSNKSGTVSPTSVTTSEVYCYYYSPNGRGAIFRMESGNRPESISEPIRQVVTECVTIDNVWLNWIANRLMCQLPWEFSESPAASSYAGATPNSTTSFVYDPSIGQGAWEAHTPALGHIRSVVELPGDKTPLAVHAGHDTARTLLRLGGASDARDTIIGTTPEPFLAFYTTNWKDGGTEELRKSWRRPRFIINNPETDLQLRVDAFRNYDPGAPYRSWVVGVDSFGRAFWRDLGAADPLPGGFDWDDGTLWEGETRGSRIVRGGPLGVARSIQLRVTAVPASIGKAWGIDAVTLKFVQRRFTT